ncbi:hypothetical protein ACFL2M_02305 [Patescibacteria group bacterium]
MTRFSAMFHKKKNQNNSGRFGEALAMLDTTKVRVILIVLIAIMAVSYLWLVNSSATLGFRLSDLDSQVLALESNYQKLELEQTALRSLEHIQEQGESMNMVATGRVDYLHGDSTVAFVEGE